MGKAKAVLAPETGKVSRPSSERSPEGAKQGRASKRKGIIKIKVEINKSGTETPRKMFPRRLWVFGNISNIDKLLARLTKEKGGDRGAASVLEAGVAGEGGGGILRTDGSPFYSPCDNTDKRDQLPNRTG